MKRVIVLLMLITLPLSAYVTVRQIYRNEQIQSQVNNLLVRQQSLFEQNKRNLAKIAILKSPARIDELAKKKLNLKEIPDDRIIHVQLIPSTGEGR